MEIESLAMDCLESDCDGLLAHFIDHLFFFTWRQRFTITVLYLAIKNRFIAISLRRCGLHNGAFNNIIVIELPFIVKEGVRVSSENKKFLNFFQFAIHFRVV